MRQYPQLYSQRDIRWAAQRLGTVNGITIGGYGCIVTCNAMKAGYYGHEITPNALDDIFTNQNIYQNGDLLPDNGLPTVFPDISLVKIYDFSNSPADLSLLQQLAQDDTLTVTIEVDFDHDPNDGIQTHFVELHNFDGTTLTIYDPWYGSDDNFTTHYGTDLKTTILKYAVYKGTPTGGTITVKTDDWKGLLIEAGNLETLAPKFSFTTNQCKTDNTVGQKISDAVDKIKTDSNNKDTTIGNLNKQIPGLETQINQLQGNLDIAQSKADKLDPLQVQYDQLEQDYKGLKANHDTLTTTTNRQVGQLKNTSYQTSSSSALFGELIARFFSGIFRTKRN